MTQGFDMEVASFHHISHMLIKEQALIKCHAKTLELHRKLNVRASDNMPDPSAKV
jgi:hypothetical protein